MNHDTGRAVSLDDAIKSHLIETSKGVYSDRAGTVSIQEAIFDGAIKVEQSKCVRYNEREINVGIVTVTKKKRYRKKSTKKLQSPNGDNNCYSHISSGNLNYIKQIAENSPNFFHNISPDAEKTVAGSDSAKAVVKTVYVVETVLDCKQNERITFNNASQRGIIDELSNEFCDTLSGTCIPITTAIQLGYLTGTHKTERFALTNKDIQNKICLQYELSNDLAGANLIPAHECDVNNSRYILSGQELLCNTNNRKWCVHLTPNRFSLALTILLSLFLSTEELFYFMVLFCLACHFIIYYVY